MSDAMTGGILGLLLLFACVALALMIGRCIEFGMRGDCDHNCNEGRNCSCGRGEK